MSGVDSGLVSQAAAYAVNHEPDAIVVATCNNEGTLPPSKVTARLHELGTFRLFRKVLRPEPSERPVHTPQDPDQEAVADNFRNNLLSIVDAARTAGVPVVLCTLPLNLLYDGDEAGIPLGGHTFETPGSVEHPPCVKAGIKQYRARQYKEAIAGLRTCEEVESLRWIGLAQFATGDTDAARGTLEEYTELLPRNRCRPSFQAIIRDVATKSPGVTLVDLDALFRSGGTTQIAGSEHFTDYCHLTKEAQGTVAGAIFGALKL